MRLKVICSGLLVAAVLSGELRVCGSAYTQRRRNPVEDRLFDRKRSRANLLKNTPVGDTLSLDTVVVRYKRKDTTLRVYKYKGTIPHFISAIGHLRSPRAVYAKEMKSLIDSPLRVYDQNGNPYRVVTYLFSYRHKDVYLDDETMSLKTKYDYVSYYVFDNPLPQKRAQYIRDEIKDGEEFWFEKIIVTNQRGEQFFAPDIHIRIE